MSILTHHRIMFLISCGLAGALTAQAQDLKCFILMPPEQILPGVRRVAVSDFSVASGYKYDDQRTAAARAAPPSQDRFTGAGAKLSDMMVAALLEKDRGVRRVSSGFIGMGSKEGMSFQEGAFTNIFTVIERNEIERVMKEQALGQSGLLDDANAAQVGNILGVEAMIVGTVKIDCVQSWLREERKEGNASKKVDCEHMATSVSGAIRVVQVETGQVIASKESRRTHDQKACKGAALTDPSKPKSKSPFGGIGDLFKFDDNMKASSPEAAVEFCLTEIVNDLVDYIAPSFKEQKLEFANVEGDQFERMVETAKNALKSPSFDNLTTAYTQYAAIVDHDAYNHGAQFNLGVLYEAVGDYKKAKEKCDLAYSLKSGDGKYRKAKERLAKQAEYWDALNALGVELKPYEFVVSEQEKADLALSRIQTKGPAKTRHEVKAGPDGASATIAQVPGEVELTVLETVAGWYKVRLPLDGKEGFLAQEKAKVLK